jgi:non-ribosomal peptide synthase protein (TIGR01720 family)
MPQADVLFNYLGRFDRVLSEESPFKLAKESSGPAFGSQGRRPYVLSINGAVTEGCLRVSWSYGEQLHRRETVQQVADRFVAALREIIAHCRAPEATGYTPSDFPQAGLNQEEIDLLMKKIGVEQEL